MLSNVPIAHLLQFKNKDAGPCVIDLPHINPASVAVGQRRTFPAHAAANRPAQLEPLFQTPHSQPRHAQRIVRIPNPNHTQVNSSSPSRFKRASLPLRGASAPLAHLPALAAAGVAMETLMVDRVNSSLRLFMHRNAVFLCERLCAQFPSEVAARSPFFLSLSRLVNEPRLA
jgi:hypothetical protein